MNGCTQCSSNKSDIPAVPPTGTETPVTSPTPDGSMAVPPAGGMDAPATAPGAEGAATPTEAAPPAQAPAAGH